MFMYVYVYIQIPPLFSQSVVIIVAFRCKEPDKGSEADEGDNNDCYELDASYDLLFEKPSCN